MKIYGIYDTKNKEQCITVGTLEDIMRCLNIRTRVINKALKGKIIQNRYYMQYLFEE